MKLHITYFPVSVTFYLLGPYILLNTPSSNILSLHFPICLLDHEDSNEIM